MRLFTGNFSRHTRKCNLGESMLVSGPILLILLVLIWATSERSFGSEKEFSLEKGGIILAASGTPIDPERFGPLWVSGYGGGAVDYSPDGSRIATAGPSMVFILNAKSHQIEKQLFPEDDSTGTGSVKWSPDGRYIAAGSASPRSINKINIWEAETGDLIKTFVGHSSRITSVVWSPEGGHLASAQEDSGVYVWEIKTGRIIRGFLGGISVVWSPDGRYIAAGDGRDIRVRVYNVETGDLVRVFEGIAFYAESLSWSPDGRHLAIAGGVGPISLWNMETGTLVRELMPGGAQSISWSPDGLYLAAAGGSVRVWEAETGRLIREVRTVGDERVLVRSSVSWSPDGNHLAFGGDGVVSIWRIEENAIASLEGHRAVVTSAIWSPDGRYIASGATNDRFP